MTNKPDVSKKKGKRIQFSLHAPQAEEVLLLGDFNQWDGTKHKMKKGKLGAWERTLVLVPGEYEYRYVVDGRWQDDPVNLQKRLNAFGTFNSVLTVVQ